MKIRMSLLLPAALAAAIPITAALAQGTPPAAPAAAPRVSADAIARLQDGRIAMAKTALRLNDAQLKLWAPVEEHIRTSFADRQKAREARMKQRDERRQARQQGKQDQARADRPALTDRLDRASQRMAQRAERMKAFSTVFKPFYESLSDEQKAVAGVVLREMRGGHPGMGGRRWAMNRDFGSRQQ